MQQQNKVTKFLFPLIFLLTGETGDTYANYGLRYLAELL